MKKVSKSFKPDKYYYRVGKKKLYYKPEGSYLRYWEVDNKGQYCGVLRYKVGILFTVALLVMLLILYKIDTTGSSNIKVQTPYVVYMDGDMLSLNINSIYTDAKNISYRLVCNDIVVTSGILAGGSSVGTVRVSSMLAQGDYPAVIEYRVGDYKKQANILLRVR